MDTIITISPSTHDDWSPRALFRRWQHALFSPARFYRHDLPAMSTTQLLTFGIGNAWAASVLAFFVQTFNTLLVSQLLERWMQKILLTEEGIAVWGLSADTFLWTAGALLLAPFLLLLRAVFSSAVLFFFARLLIEERAGAPEAVSYEGCLRLRAGALVGRWFAVVPVFGGLLAFVVGLILTITGVRERFGVSTRRASAVVLAPYVVALFLALLLAAFVVLLLSQISLQDLLDMDAKDLGL